MPPPISDDLSRISKASKQLNTVSDEITKQIRDLDAFLSSLNLGLEYSENASFYSGSEKNDGGHRVEVDYYIGYGRDDDGKFGLLVEAFGNLLDEDGKPTRDRYGTEEIEQCRILVRPLGQASRAIRLKAMARLPLFIASFAGIVEAAVADGLKHLEATKKASEELRSALSDSQPASQTDSAPSASRHPKRLTAEGHRTLIKNQPDADDEPAGNM